MENKKYLTEENYERGKKKIKTIALVILLLGLLLGGSLIAIGIIKQLKVNSQYSEENRIIISEQLETEKQSLINKKSELETKIEPIENQIKKLRREPFNGFDDAYYERQDEIEKLKKSIDADTKTISIINEVLENADFACAFDGENNSYTAKYCSLSNQLSNINSDSKKISDSYGSIPFYMIGGFVIIASCIMAGSIYMFSKRREIAAFTTQQIMPVAKEGIDEMAPTIGNAAGEIAKGITSGIKEGLKDETNK